MISATGGNSLLSSGLSLWNQALASASEGSALAAGGNPDVLLDAAMRLQTARQSAGLAQAVIDLAQELDQATLDILA